MFMKFMPLGLVVLSSVLYHLSQKATPSGLSPFVALIITYVTASVVAILAYLMLEPKADVVHFSQALKHVNWASMLLGCAVVGLEMGFLLAYRSGWNISVASLLSNTLVALVLIPVGLLLFKESISSGTVLGVCFCVVGLVLVSR